MIVSISYENAVSQILDIKIEISNLAGRSSEFHLPAWRPGRYELQNYAQNMYKVQAYSPKMELALEVVKTSINTWRVEHGEFETIILTYQYVAQQMDAGGSWLDDEQVYINFINCVLFNKDKINEPVELILNIPKKFRIATGLKMLDSGNYLAKDYHELVDCPIIASDTLLELNYEIDKVKFHIWFQGAGELNEEKIIRDFEAFSRVQMELFNGFPSDQYHFLIQLVKYPKYHGVEHHNSTVITLGPDINFDSEKSYIDLLGISSHELFHVWNIKSIRPKELSPYDYTRPIFFDTGYIAEGVTTYYGDLMLARSGVFDDEQYIKEVDQYLERHFKNPGRHQFSLAQSSHDLWVDGYKRSPASRKVSIYIKGALIALLLDLRLREYTGNRVNLDHVVQEMWRKSQEEGDDGYTTSDYKTIIEDLTGTSWDDYFDQFVYGIDPLEDHLDKAFSYINCRLDISSGTSFIRYRLGLLVDKTNKITFIDPKSPCLTQCSIGDRLKTINGVEPSNVDTKHISKSKIKIEVNRYGRELIVFINLDHDQFYLKNHTLKRNFDINTGEMSFHSFVNNL